MNPQENPQEMTPDQAAASLAFATSISEKMFLPQQSMTEAPSTESEPSVDLEQFKEEIMTAVKEEINSIKEDIKSALEQEDVQN